MIIHYKLIAIHPDWHTPAMTAKAAPLAIDTPEGRAMYIAGTLPEAQYLLNDQEYPLVPLRMADKR